MSAGLTSEGGSAGSARIMPPYRLVRDLLDAATVAGLLDHAVQNQALFSATRVGAGPGSGTKPAVRISTGTRELGPYKQTFRSKISELTPGFIADLRVTPFQPDKIELELVAHADGAFYKRHIDTQTGTELDGQRIRVLSGVYYFKAEPKAFSGGALRLYALGDAAHETFVDIEPAHNSLLVFPSWAPHQVMPVQCPSKRFIDSRFAVNCWVYRVKRDAAAPR